MPYELNSKNVVQDTIDGEVLAIRSDTGAYYSMSGPAASAWLGLISGHSIDDLAAAIAAHHGIDDRAIGDDLDRFAVLLAQETLLVESHGGPASGELSLPSDTRGTPWTEPVFEKYTDMEDLLLFDPIHEVQPAGWPNTADDNA